MRVSTAFNRLLQIPGASVSDVSITDSLVEVTLRLTARRVKCPCGYSSTAAYDREPRRWRHLDFGRHKVWLVYSIRRIECPTCGVRTEDIPWARPRARHSRDFEDTVLWLVTRTDRTSVSTLMRCAWRTVTSIVTRAVDALIDSRRLDRLYRIGVDEICYRHPHKYLTIVGDHDTGKVVYISEGRGRDSFSEFFEQQSAQEREEVQVVSMDGSPAFRAAAEHHVPQARQCMDPFHVMQWVNRALDRVFSDAASIRRTLTMQAPQWRKARTALRLGKNRLTKTHKSLLRTVTAADTEVGTAWRLKEQFRDLYRKVAPSNAARYLRRWIEEAKSCGISAFVQLARMIDKKSEAICAAIELGISNALIEGINSKIRLINARGYGHHSAASLKAMIYLNLGGIEVKLPTQR